MQRPVTARGDAPLIEVRVLRVAEAEALEGDALNRVGLSAGDVEQGLERRYDPAIARRRSSAWASVVWVNSVAARAPVSVRYKLGRGRKPPPRPPSGNIVEGRDPVKISRERKSKLAVVNQVKRPGHFVEKVLFRSVEQLNCVFNLPTSLCVNRAGGLRARRKVSTF